MNTNKLLIICICSLLFAGCTSTNDPAKRTTFDIFTDPITGKGAKALAQMEAKLNELDAQAESIGMDILFYQAELDGIKKDLAKLEIPTKELEAINAEIARLENEASTLDDRNRQNKEMVSQRKDDISKSDVEAKQLEGEIDTLNKRVETVDKQADIVRNGIKDLARKRVLYASKD